MGERIKCAVYTQVPPYRMKCEPCLVAGKCVFEATVPFGNILAWGQGRKDVIDEIGSEEIRQAIRKIMYDSTIQLYEKVDLIIAKIKEMLR
jgi:hypothetical protein